MHGGLYVCSVTPQNCMGTIGPDNVSEVSLFRIWGGVLNSGMSLYNYKINAQSVGGTCIIMLTTGPLYHTCMHIHIPLTN